VATRLGPGPRDGPLVGDAGRPRGARERHNGDRRPPRVAQRHRGEPGRDRGGMRRGGRPRRAGVRGHGPPRPRRGPARPGRKRALHPRRGARAGRDPRLLHLHRRNSARRRRTGRGPRRGSPRPRLRGDDRRRRAGAAGRTHARRLAPGPLRPPAHRPLAPGNGPPQPPLQPEQRRRLREPGAVRQPGGPRHGRDRRQRAGVVPVGLRDAALGGRDLRPGHRLALAGAGLGPGPGGPQRRGDLVVRPDGPLARRVHAGHPAAAGRGRRPDSPRGREADQSGLGRDPREGAEDGRRPAGPAGTLQAR
jgi:hypothetical protein